MLSVTSQHVNCHVHPYTHTQKKKKMHHHRQARQIQQIKDLTKGKWDFSSSISTLAISAPNYKTLYYRDKRKHTIPSYSLTGTLKPYSFISRKYTKTCLITTTRITIVLSVSQYLPPFLYYYYQRRRVDQSNEV